MNLAQKLNEQDRDRLEKEKEKLMKLYQAKLQQSKAEKEKLIEIQQAELADREKQNLSRQKALEERLTAIENEKFAQEQELSDISRTQVSLDISGQREPLNHENERTGDVKQIIDDNKGFGILPELVIEESIFEQDAQKTPVLQSQLEGKVEEELLERKKDPEGGVIQIIDDFKGFGILPEHGIEESDYAQDIKEPTVPQGALEVKLLADPSISEQRSGYALQEEIIKEKKGSEKHAGIEENKQVGIRSLKKIERHKAVFGKAEWRKYFGDIGIEPPLPEDINEILESPCAYWPNKKVEDTHLLVLIPKTVCGKSFTLNRLVEMIPSPRGSGSATKFYYWDNKKSQVGEKGVECSYWILICKAVIPYSMGKTYQEQCKLLQTSYRVSTVLELATSVLMYYVSTGERLYSGPPWVYGRCAEKVAKCELAVGGFSRGLEVLSSFNYTNHGLSVSRPLFYSGLIKTAKHSYWNPLTRVGDVARKRLFNRQKSPSKNAMTFRNKVDLAQKSKSTALPQTAFGKADWEKYFGDVGEEPPLPQNINEILQSSCKYWPDKKVEDTHLLVLIPKTVDGRALTLETLGELIEKPKGGGHLEKYCDVTGNSEKAFTKYSEELENMGVASVFPELSEFTEDSFRVFCEAEALVEPKTHEHEKFVFQAMTSLLSDKLNSLQLRLNGRVLTLELLEEFIDAYNRDSYVSKYNCMNHLANLARIFKLEQNIMSPEEKEISKKEIFSEITHDISRNIRREVCRVLLSNAEHFLNKVNRISVEKSYWTLITKKAIPDSKGREFEEQRKLLMPFYKVPRTLELTVAMLMHHTKTGVRLQTSTVGYCEEEDIIGRVIAGFSLSGFLIAADFAILDIHKIDDLGLNASRVF